MEPVTKKSWRQRSWTIPLSVMLHVLIVGVFYLQWPENIQAPAEPESVSVELVEPPKEEPPKEEPKPQPEEEKAEEPPPPPPPPPPAETKPPEPAPQTRIPNIAIRPDGTQLDERDDPATQEETGGQEQPKPAEEPETSQPEPKPTEEAQKYETPPEPSSSKPTAEQGEIAAVEADAPPDTAAVAVPTPKPEVETKPEEEPKAQPDGAGDPKLKPAKKILAGAKAPTPMRRQILGQLPPRQRVAQLCIVEALAQIKDERKGQSPAEGLEPHIGKNEPIVGNVLDAYGAFNVGAEWYPIHYRCEIDMDRYLVTDFRFDIGKKFSADDVKKIGLVAD
ncbi:DUF930 domain-containing protein [Agrobacterium sp. rho-13.3]|uniref:DUF930 domain-containing protein n=1 Tax=Agrobacterium sp. rho-13.3 TaxID=3072980 RepID=UPI002A1572D2|nr:DUF930 domain-containing protein [Agrobacterium sp. rho-13.3]MDX8310106.1 DUF930 domain-containing protein [Agrobacterium sp. rho-13.3]